MGAVHEERCWHPGPGRGSGSLREEPAFRGPGRREEGSERLHAEGPLSVPRTHPARARLRAPVLAPPPRTTLGQSWLAPSRQQLGEAPLPRALVQQSPCAHPLWPDPV